MVLGPQSPFANIPVVIDGMVDWIGKAIRHMRANGLDTLEARPDAVEAWRKHVDALVNATVLSKGRSWFLGDNIPGKPHVTLFHFGGAGVYRRECLEEAAKGYEGFVATCAET